MHGSTTAHVTSDAGPGEATPVSNAVDRAHHVAPAALQDRSRAEIERHARACELRIRAHTASEREYALYISAMRELARRAGADV